MVTNNMADILLVEPDYKNKYPPLGLMKISYYHKHMRKDFVMFAKGRLHENLDGKKWDRVYVTTLFTFEWKKTKKAIEYAISVANTPSDVYVGGIMATLMPDLFRETFPNVNLLTGLLNRAGALGLPHDECIDRITPDYSILDDVDYKYPANDAYFLYMTRGCGMKCQFCAVQTLEPLYVPYISIREQIETIDKKFGKKRYLLLMDNNVLRSREFDKIVDELIDLGFGKGGTYESPVSKKPLQRYIDFNQGLDAKLMTPEKAKRLGELAISPARIAFDHIEDEEQYKKALDLCASNGIKYLSNYILYNGEDFTGKGQKYSADTPADLYNRMKISMDFCDELNEKYGENGRVHIFSFPMKYIPLNALDRTFVGTHWNKKYLRAIQRMLIPTQGKGVSTRSFFEAAFGATVEVFIENLAMPEDLLGLRGHFVEKKDETKSERKLRHETWVRNHLKIDEWRKLYRSLNGEIEPLLKLIGNNDFSMHNYKTYKNNLILRKMFVWNLSSLAILRNIETLGAEILDYFFRELGFVYQELIRYVIDSKHTQFSALIGLLKMRKKAFIDDILNSFIEKPFWETNIFDALYKAQNINGIILFDTRGLDLALRFREGGVISDTEYRNLCRAGIESNGQKIVKKLSTKLPELKTSLMQANNEEIAKTIVIEKIEETLGKIKKTFKSMGV